MDSVIKQYKIIYGTICSINDEIAFHEAQQVKLKEAFEHEKQAFIQQHHMLLQEWKENQIKVSAYIKMAKPYVFQEVTEITPKPWNAACLASLAIKITPVNHDPIAFQLYEEALAQYAAIEQLIQDSDQRKASHLEELLVNLKQNLEAHQCAVQDCLIRLKTYISSDEWKSFIAHIRQVDHTFTKCESSDVHPMHMIMLGRFQAPLPIHEDCIAHVASLLGALYQAETSSISLPYELDVTQDSSYIFQYTYESESTILAGIQKFLFNTLLYAHEHINSIYLFDPIHFHNQSLGSLATLTSTSYVNDVPFDQEEVKQQLDQLMRTLNKECDSLNNRKRILIFHNFPSGYDASMISQIQKLCANKEQYHVVILMTQNAKIAISHPPDAVQYIQACSQMINIQEETCYIDVHQKPYPFVWLKAPDVIPDSMIESLQCEVVEPQKSNVYEERVGCHIIMREKGNRSLEQIAYGIDEQGSLMYLDFENSNFASFICGASRSGKSTFLHTLITGIIKHTHPDDVELWLIDFKMTEFSRYIQHLPPHIRYIVLDESVELVFDIIDRLTDIMNKRQSMFKAKWQKLADVPKEKYMPSILVIIDEFSVMSQIIGDSMEYSSDNYRVKLQNLLAKGSALGMHFIFSSQGFTSGTRGLTDFSKKQIQQRIALKTEYSEIRETLDLKTISETDRMLMEQLQVHHALIRAMDENGNHCKLVKLLYFKDYHKQEQFIDDLKQRFHPVATFEPQQWDCYIDKRTMIIDGNGYHSFASKRKDMLAQLPASDEETLLFVGEPRRLTSLAAIPLIHSYCENLILLMSKQEQDTTASLVYSIVESLRLQHRNIEVWSRKNNAIYQTALQHHSDDLTCHFDLEDLCERIKQIKHNIVSRIPSNTYIMMFEIDAFMMDMSYQTQASSNQFDRWNAVTVERREEGAPDLLSKMAESSTLMERLTQKIEAVEQKKEPMNDLAYDAREDLKYIMMHGPRFGYHFITLFHHINEFKQCKFDSSVFKHKILTRLAKLDVSDFITMGETKLLANLQDHTYRYMNGLETLSFRPYLHAHIGIDHTSLDDDGNVIIQEEEEYLL